METRAKERLTGAVILVALVVLVVPELLSGPAPPAAHSAVSSASPGESQTRSFVIRLSGALAGSSGAAAARSTALAVSTVPAVSTVTAVSTPPGASTVARATATGAAAAEPKQVPVARARPPAPARSTRVAAPGAGKPALARPSPRTAPRSAGTAWSVQLGSFLARDHAQRLARELAARGFRASVSRRKSRGRIWYRVRVGPEPSRATALAVARRLRADGHGGELVRGP